MIPILVPTLALDLSLMERLYESIDHPFQLAVVNNGTPFATKHRWPIYQQDSNLGVAASWNLAPKIFYGKDAWVISNDDQIFQPGALAKCEQAIKEHAHDSHIIYVNEFDAYDFFIWTRKGYEEIGPFDENFYPAYFEDYEYRCRLKVAKASIYRIPPPFPVRHGRERPGGPRYMRMLQQCKPINEAYLECKWGTRGDNPAFDTPFNSGASIKTCPLLDGRRAILKSIWDEFWNDGNCSIYE